MKKILILLLFFFVIPFISQASNKENIVKKLSKTENVSFSFIQTIGGKDEK